MKQTAIDWLVEQISYKTTSGEVISYHKDITDLIHQAKEMEKQQIVAAHGSKLISPKGLASEYWVNGEEYYNKTFNKGQK